MQSQGPAEARLCLGSGQSVQLLGLFCFRSAGPCRGVAAGGSSNRRQLGETALRKDETAPYMLAVASQLHTLLLRFDSFTGVPVLDRNRIESSAGHAWRKLVI